MVVKHCCWFQYVESTSWPKKWMLGWAVDGVLEKHNMASACTGSHKVCHVCGAGSHHLPSEQQSEDFNHFDSISCSRNSARDLILSAYLHISLKYIFPFNMIFPLISNMSSQVHRGKVFLIISLRKSHLHPMNFEFFLHSYIHWGSNFGFSVLPKDTLTLNPHPCHIWIGH